jgi:hypothetical protein
VSERKIAVALEAVTGLALASKVTVIAREVESDYCGPIPSPKVKFLEFFVSEDIPGHPFGFRNIQSKIITWTHLRLAADEMLRFWPPAHESPKRNA